MRGELEVEEAILELLAGRGAGKSICPSEVARRVGGDDWRDLMKPVRETAARLASKKRIRITQGEVELDPAGPIKGAIRLRLPEADG